MKERLSKIFSIIISVGVCCGLLASCCGDSTDDAPQTENTSGEVEIIE